MSDRYSPLVTSLIDKLRACEVRVWLDPDTVSYTVLKNGSYPSRCSYRLIADTAAGYPPVDGWSTTTLRSTAGRKATRSMT